MTDPIQAFMQANSLESPAFPPTSRYYGLPTRLWVRPDGRSVVFIGPRAGIGNPVTGINVVFDWFEELRQRVGN